jgi:6-phosphofructokinase 1
LGHLQRGGPPSFKDRMMATQFGAKSVEMLLNGVYNKLIGTKAGEIYDYDLKENTTKKIPKDMEALQLVKKLSIY